MNPEAEKLLTRISRFRACCRHRIGDQTGILRAAFGTPAACTPSFVLLIPYPIAGYDVIAGALRGLAHGHALDEDFLMTVATFGAFALVLFPDTEPHMAEGAAVMLFFQVGELSQSYAVDKVAPVHRGHDGYRARSTRNVMEEGELKQVDPFELAPDDEFIVMPGERIPLDGTVLTGESQSDTAALTGESVPRTARPGRRGHLRLREPGSQTLVVRATKPFEDSTVSRILELVEKRRREEGTHRTSSPASPACTPPSCGRGRCTRHRAPAVVRRSVSDWILRGLTFLVVSCPCALVISVPLSFFGGIGGASASAFW